jgi:peptidoglycan L-alanyl-D-glutamate endopeptidase CwlK
VSDEPPAPDLLLPRHDLELLVPDFRGRLALLLDACAAEGIPLAAFETVRSPIRQAFLWAKGRVPGLPDYGRRVTWARPYESAHQWGLATDLVFRVDGKWSWVEPEPGMWQRRNVLALRHGLETLRREQAHVQLAGFAWQDLVRQRGPGDAAGWEAWLRGRVGG